MFVPTHFISKSYRDHFGVAEKVSYPDGAKHPKGRSDQRGQIPSPEMQDLAIHGICLRFCLLFVTLVYGVAANANPSTVDPNRSLATHGTLKGVAELVAQAEKVAAESADLVNEIDRLVERGNMERFPGKKVANIISKLRQAFRNQEQLLILGEPLGVDLEMRLTSSNKKLHDYCLAYISTPAGLRVRNGMAAKLLKEQPKRLEQFEKIMKLVEEGKAQDAENLLIPVGDELFTEVWFVPLEVRIPFQAPYYQANSAVEAPMRKLRAAAANLEINQVIARIKPDPTAMDAWGRDVAGQLRANGTAAWSEREPAGAVATFDELLRRWTIGHTAFQRIAALQWVLHRNGGTTNAMSNGQANDASLGTSDPSTNSADPDSRSGTLAADAIRWNDSALVVASEIIKADAARLTPDAIPQRHQEYLERSVRILSNTQATSVKSSLEEALAVLISGNRAYADSVEQYSAATRDVMTFRGRIAQAQAKRLSAGFSSADAVVREATLADPECRGLYQPNPNQPSVATLFEPSQKIMTLRSPRLVNRNVRVDHVVTIPTQNRVSLSHFSGRTYGSYTQPVTVGLPIEEMKSYLMVDNSYRPLSLDATRAIHNAEIGNYLAVGGQVTVAHLESMITRFASLGLIDSSIMPWGSVVSIPDSVDVLPQMAMRLEIAPIWVQHELFFAKLDGQP
jgi:hypothetical protein